MLNLIKLEEVDSTNEWAKRNIEKLSDLDGVIARIQSRGKGRGSNKWFSPSGGLWLTLMIKEFPSNKGVLSQLSSVAIAEVLENYGLHVELKWPNDIIISKKKIGGVLIEGRNESFIVGIGLNLNLDVSDFPQSLQENIISSKEILKRNLPIEEVALEIMKRIGECREELDRVYIRYLGLNQDLGRKVELQGQKETITGQVIGIENDGGIRIRSEGKENTYYSGSLVYI
ncbi:MAG: biotin--[acetyl-CoA-carboxylase] ligase [Candidatus Stahlbacteria bacterium]|nr:MAG: biotin--[acetyl-CoA-carboxylase] ligase [Candidatus Stahlbacteria bacterium]